MTDVIDNRMEDTIVSVFKLVDTDCSGELDSAEFRRMLKNVKGLTPLAQQSIWAAMDLDRNKSISLDEFRAWARDPKNSKVLNAEATLGEVKRKTGKATGAVAFADALVKLQRAASESNAAAANKGGLAEKSRLEAAAVKGAQDFLASEAMAALRQALQAAAAGEGRGALEGVLAEGEFVAVCAGSAALMAVLEPQQLPELFRRLTEDAPVAAWNPQHC